MPLPTTATVPSEAHEEENKEASGGLEEDLRVPLLETAAVSSPSSSAATKDAPQQQSAGRGAARSSATASLPPNSFSVPIIQSPALNMEDPGTFWRQQRLLMMLWLTVSITSFMLFMIMDMGTGVFMMAELAAILGIVAPLICLFPSFSGGLDLATQAKLVYILGRVSGVLDLLTLFMVDLALLSLTTDCTSGPAAGEEQVSCSTTWILIVFFSCLLGTHTWVCFFMSRRAYSAQLLLNPVSSGLVRV